MVKTHEINLDVLAFNQIIASNVIIIEDEGKNISNNDYILFRQVDEEEQATDLYLLAQVININKHKGLKDGYIMMTINKF